MRNSAENKPFRIARYCSCPTFLHSRERGKVATVSRRSRLDSPPPTDKGDKWRKHGTDGTEGRRRREFERAIGYRFVARFRPVPFRPFTYRGDPSFCFSLVSPAAFPLSLPNVTAPFPANRTTDCRRNRNRRDQRVKIRFSQETFHNSVAQHESLDLLNSFDRFDRKFRIRAWPCIDAPMRRKKEREREKLRIMEEKCRRANNIFIARYVEYSARLWK